MHSLWGMDVEKCAVGRSKVCIFVENVRNSTLRQV